MQQDTNARGQQDYFTNQLDPEQFRLTNGPWNELCLNDPWSVGIVTNIIELRVFENKEDWERFYYNMGEVRLKELSRLDAETVQTLDNELLVTYDTEIIQNLDWKVKNINYQNGRTQEQLAAKGKILHGYCLKKGLNISEADCVEAVRYRVICETWNGIMVREKNAIHTLQEYFKSFRFQKTEGRFDLQFAVDYEVYAESQKVCGLQIKPASYFKSFAPYIKRAKSINAMKNREYKQQHGLPVFEVIADMKGTVLNHDILQQIAASAQPGSGS